MKKFGLFVLLLALLLPVGGAFAAPPTVTLESVYYSDTFAQIFDLEQIQPYRPIQFNYRLSTDSFSYESLITTNNRVSRFSGTRSGTTLFPVNISGFYSEETGTISLKATSGGETGSLVTAITAIHSEQPAVHVTGIDLKDPDDIFGGYKNQISLSLVPGEQKGIEYTVTPNNATNRTVSWRSTNESVATVEKGVHNDTVIIRTLAAGTCSIILTAEDGGHTATCNLTVTGGATGGRIQIVPDVVYLGVGESEIVSNQSANGSTHEFLTLLMLEDLFAGIFVDDPTVVAVNADGNGYITIYGLKPGTTKVRVKLFHGNDPTVPSGDTAECTVIVEQKSSQASNVTLPGTVNVAAGDYFDLVADLPNGLKSNEELKWEIAGTGGILKISNVSSDGKRATFEALKEGKDIVNVYIMDTTQVNYAVASANCPIIVGAASSGSSGGGCGAGLGFIAMGLAVVPLLRRK